jgi:hypothetical protein
MEGTHYNEHGKKNGVSRLGDVKSYPSYQTWENKFVYLRASILRCVGREGK